MRLFVLVQGFNVKFAWTFCVASWCIASAGPAALDNDSADCMYDTTAMIHVGATVHRFAHARDSLNRSSGVSLVDLSVYQDDAEDEGVSTTTTIGCCPTTSTSITVTTTTKTTTTPMDGAQEPLRMWIAMAYVGTKFYFTPADAADILSYDPKTKTLGKIPLASTTNPVDYGAISSKWSGATVYQDEFYAGPGNELSMLLYNPTGNFVSFIDVSSYTQANTILPWYGIMALHDFLYMCPYNDDSLLIFDAKQTNFSLVLTSGVANGYAKWHGLVAYDNVIYGSPFNAEAMLAFAVDSHGMPWKLLSSISTSGVETGTGKWSDPVQFGGKIYAVPLNAANILVYDPSSKSVSGVSTTHIYNAGGNKWLGSMVIGLEILAAPLNADQVLVFNPKNNDVSGVATDSVDTGSFKWGGVSQWSDGIDKMYATPATAHNILEFNPSQGHVSSVSIQSILAEIVTTSTTSTTAAPR